MNSRSEARVRREWMNTDVMIDEQRSFSIMTDESDPASGTKKGAVPK